VVLILTVDSNTMTGNFAHTFFSCETVMIHVQIGAGEKIPAERVFFVLLMKCC